MSCLKKKKEKPKISSFFCVFPLFPLKDSDYVIAERNFVTDERSMLSFHKGDIIRLQVMDGLEKGEALVWKSRCILCESAADSWAHICLCSFSRVQLWLRGEEEGCVFGGAQKRHSGLWYLWNPVILITKNNQFCTEFPDVGRGPNINKATIQNDGFKGFTNLCCAVYPGDVRVFLKPGKNSSSIVVLTAPAALFRYNIVSENYFPDGWLQCSSKTIDLCVFLRT